MRKKIHIANSAHLVAIFKKIFTNEKDQPICDLLKWSIDYDPSTNLPDISQINIGNKAISLKTWGYIEKALRSAEIEEDTISSIIARMKHGIEMRDTCFYNAQKMFDDLNKSIKEFNASIKK